MMKLIKIVIAVLPCFFLNSCEGQEPVQPGPSGGNGQSELPSPPEKVKDANVFLVDMFSTLEDEGTFFEMRAVSSAEQHISGQSGKLPLVYMFDRADFTVGKSHPLNQMSYDINIYQFFAQHEATSSTTTKGTAIATKYPISLYDGIAQSGTYMSGCTLPAPLSTPTQVCFYTTRITSLDQLKVIYDAKSRKLLDNGVVIATVANTVKDELVQYAQQTMSVRATTFGSDQTKLDILVMVPPAYVCRGIEKGSTINLPYYRVKIEKWM